MTNQILFFLALTVFLSSKTTQAYVQPPEERQPTKMDFERALKVAKATAFRLVSLPPKAIAEELSKVNYEKIAASGSEIVFATMENGVYTYVWGNTSDSNKFEVLSVLVEFYSGGLWFQVGSEKYLVDHETLKAAENSSFKTPSIYWFNPTTDKGGRLSPHLEVKQANSLLGAVLELNYKITDASSKNDSKVPNKTEVSDTTKVSGTDNETGTAKTESKSPE